MLADALVIIAPDLAHGGSVGAVAWRHALELSRSFKVYVITRAVPDGVPANIEPVIVRHSGWNWLRRFCHVPNELSFLWAAREALKKLGTRESIKAVWCHSHGAAALVASPLKRTLGCRTVMTTHGDIFDRPAGTYSRELTWFYKKVTPMAYRQTDVVHALSPYMVEWAVKGGSARDQVRLVPNGIDPQDIGATALVPRAADSFMSAGTLRLLYVGSLWSVKGVDVLIRAVAELNAIPTGMAVSLTLIGEGTLRHELEGLVAALGLEKQVSFLGRVPRRNLLPHYQAADILCVPSISEALPTVALEAMLCGLPVVGSNTGGIPFLVNEGVNGYLATPGDVASLGRAIAKAAASRGHLAELGEQSFIKARAGFGWAGIAIQLAELVSAPVFPQPIPSQGS